MKKLCVFPLMVSLSLTASLCPDIIHGQWRAFDTWAASMGDAFTATAHSPSGLMYNPAGLTLADNRQVSSNYVNRYHLPEINEVTVGFSDPVSIPKPFGAYGVAISNVGFQNLYNDISVNVGYAFLILNRASLGVSVNYRNVSIRGYGSGHAVSFSFGAIQIVIPELLIGIAAKNIGNFGNISDGSQPSFSAGITYIPLKELQVALDVEKEEPFPVSVKTGLAYEPIDAFGIAFGVISYPLTITGGVGIRFLSVELDYGIAYHTELGLSHSVGLLFSFDLFADKKKTSHGRIGTLKNVINNLATISVLPEHK